MLLPVPEFPSAPRRYAILKPLAIAGLTALAAGACADATGPQDAASFSPDVVALATSSSTTAVLSNALVVEGSPITYSVNFGFAFSDITQVDYFFTFGNDALDAGECLIFRGGFCNPGPAPQTSRLLTIPCVNDPAECDLLRDGVDTRQVTAERWFGAGLVSVEIAALSITVHGTIASPAVQLQGIVGQLHQLQIAGILSKGQANSLRQKLLAAIDLLNAGKTTPAVKLLDGFNHEVAGLMAGNHPALTAAQGQLLINAANAVMAGL